MYISSTIAHTFAYFRLKYHFGTYKEVSSNTGIDILVLMDIESGGCHVPKSTLEKLCDYYYIRSWRKSILCTGRARLKNGDELRIRKNKFYLNNKRVRIKNIKV